MIWNSTASSFEVHNPPEARNYLIGAIGTVIDSSTNSETYDSLGQRIQFNDVDNPMDSLYIAQMLQRERFPYIQQREYWVGDFDQLENDGAADQIDIDSQWLTDIENISTFVSNQQTIGFDEVLFGSKVPFTINFEIAPDEVVVSVFLTIGMNRNGGESSDNDLLYLDRTDSPLTFLPEEWGFREDGETLQVLSLELLGDLSYLQDGQLNGLLTNNRAIDWGHLVVNSAPISAIPEPGSAFMLIMLGLAASIRRRR